MLHLLSFPLVAAFDFHVPAYMIAILIPVAGMILGGTIAISAMYFKHQQQRLWHETARVALEKGQPVPDFPSQREFSRRESRGGGLGQHDLRAGLILVAVGAGIYLFFATVGGGQEARFLGAIPGFMGVALILHAIITGLFAKKDSTADTRPPQS